jgi:GR25 family glycosyltransferase involved in LPS biosynthesis
LIQLAFVGGYQIQSQQIHAQVIGLEHGFRGEKLVDRLNELGFAASRSPGILVNLGEWGWAQTIRRFESLHGRKPLPGEVGCTLAHLGAWRKFIESGSPWGLIFEDDMGIPQSFTPQKLQKALVAFPDTRPTVVSLAYRSAIHVGYSFMPFGKIQADFPNLDKQVDFRFRRAITPPILAGSYIINRVAAENLIKTTEPYMLADWPVGSMASTKHFVAVPRLSWPISREVESHVDPHSERAKNEVTKSRFSSIAKLFSLLQKLCSLENHKLAKGTPNLLVFSLYRPLILKLDEVLQRIAFYLQPCWVQSRKNP